MKLEWQEACKKEGGQGITLETTLKLSVPIYKEKMHIDYARPLKQDLAAHFESIGLRGDFWKL